MRLSPMPEYDQKTMRSVLDNFRGWIREIRQKGLIEGKVKINNEIKLLLLVSYQ